jgi:class 3 adenylate cyclase/DNA-binding CsgD family transcriptional regulator
MSASPGAAAELTQMNMEIDIRNVLPTIQVPTLIIHRTDDLAIRVECSRYIAEQIPSAIYVELPGRDHLPFVGDQDAILDEVQDFLTGVRPVRSPSRMVATLLVTGVKGATDTSTRLDDAQWRTVRDTYATLVRQELAEYRAKEVGTTEVSIVASFDSPSRGIQCAWAIVDAARQAGIDVGAGMHAGECELVGSDVRGVAVQLAARVLAHADPGTVVVSQTVKDLVAGSDIAFHDLGTFPLKGSTGEWHLYQITSSSTTGVAATAPSRMESRTRPRLWPLSHREGEIATLVALGLSNRQIAEDLVIAESTVERHVANILKKLDYHTRAQIAAWTVEHGLLRGRAV